VDGTGGEALVDTGSALLGTRTALVGMGWGREQNILSCHPLRVVMVRNRVSVSCGLQLSGSRLLLGWILGRTL